MPQNTTSTRRSIASWLTYACLLTLMLFGGLPVTKLQAQTPTLIDLRRELIYYTPKEFYIAKVSDGRERKDSIGIVHNGMANRKNKADLRGGLEKCLGDYLRWTLPRDSSKRAVEMEITYFLIEETLEFVTERAQFEMVAVFYDLSAERQALYVSKLKIEERMSVDVTASHERRIRTALLQAIKDLDAEGPWTQGMTIGQTLPPSNQTGGSDSLAVSSFQAMKTDSALASTADFNTINTPLSANNNTAGLGLGFMLLGSRQIAVNSTGWIGTAYFFFNQDPNDWQVPLAIGFEQLVISDAAVIRNGWAPMELNYRLPGLAAFRKIDNLVHLGLFLNVPFGVERTINLTTLQSLERNFIGLGGGMGLYLMSNTTASLVAGLRLHLMSTNSLSYPREAGLRIEAGFRF